MYDAFPNSKRDLLQKNSLTYCCSLLLLNAVFKNVSMLYSVWNITKSNFSWREIGKTNFIIHKDITSSNHASFKNPKCFLNSRANPPLQVRVIVSTPSDADEAKQSTQHGKNNSKRKSFITGLLKVLTLNIRNTFFNFFFKVSFWITLKVEITLLGQRWTYSWLFYTSHSNQLDGRAHIHVI